METRISAIIHQLFILYNNMTKGGNSIKYEVVHGIISFHFFTSSCHKFVNLVVQLFQFTFGVYDDSNCFGFIVTAQPKFVYISRNPCQTFINHVTICFVSIIDYIEWTATTSIVMTQIKSR